ncbi:peptidoglycan editing factor PgeF [Rhodoferax sp.]|uniref:peptidoglycan editing factor PgeF n=1 Tax=Rhodoferax sp. TaxID=50421 RepID=UPI001ECEF27F|nr:peptidoglycan editing factor PgeF [Rhodoferax sp.]MBT9506582.1 peptidoglycan editing factor PgeF [Rhodoferax sp.]
MNPDWLVPHWPAPAHVRAVCTTRLGGKSVAPYDSLNLGDHVGDHPLDVGVNRAILHQAIHARPVFLSQVHGADVVWLSEKTPHGTPADGCLTAQSGVACTIMVADCLPVLFTNVQGSLVAAAHAGWRGLAGVGGYGVLEAVVDEFRDKALVDKAQDASEIIAWLGPCIGPHAFEVGDDVRDAFAMHDPAALAMFAPADSGKWLANLNGLARLRLDALGVTEIYGNDGGQVWCTVSNPSRFFSFRRDGACGRMAATVWLE